MITDGQTETTQGAGAQPNAQASGQSSSLDVDAIVKALTPHIETIVDRKTQSVKDKRIAGMQGEIDGFKSQLTQLKALQAEGWTEAQAIRLMESQSRPQPATEQAAPQQARNGNSTHAASVDTAVINAFGLDANDPEVTNVLRENPDAYSQALKLATIALQRKERPVSQAQMQPAGNNPRTIETRDTVAEELNRLVGKPGKTNADWNQMANLQAKMRSME